MLISQTVLNLLRWGNYLYLLYKYYILIFIFLLTYGQSLQLMRCTRRIEDNLSKRYPVSSARSVCGWGYDRAQYNCKYMFLCYFLLFFIVVQWSVNLRRAALMMPLGQRGEAIVRWTTQTSWIALDGWYTKLVFITISWSPINYYKICL